MRIAVSVPDQVFRAAEQLARRLCISRSQLYPEALQSYLAAHERQDVAERLNEIHGSLSAKPGLDPVLAELQDRALLSEGCQVPREGDARSKLVLPL